MKKGFIFATTLAMALGVGVAVGAHQSKAAEVKADTSSVKIAGSFTNWAANAIELIDTTPVDNKYVYTREFAENDEFKIVVNNSDWIAAHWNGVANNTEGGIVDGGGDDHNFKVATADKYTIKIATNIGDYGEKGYGVEIEKYETPVAPEYHVLGTFNDWGDEKGDFILTVDPEDENHFTLADLELEAEDQLKVCDVKHNVWYGNGVGGGNVPVPENGTYDIDFYVKADNYEHIVLNKHVVEPVYTIVNRNNEPVTFVLDEDDKPEGVKHQYSAEIQYACRGGELKFYADAVQITSNIYVDAGDAEHVNNVYGNTTDGFRLRHTANYAGYTKIYLKTYDNGSCSVWGEGYDEDWFTTAVKTAPSEGKAYNFVKDDTFEPNETYIEQFKTTTAVALKALPGSEWATSNDIMCDGLSVDITPEDVANNNAMQAFQKTAWKVHNDCIEVIYLKIKRTDLSVMMYIGGYEEAVVVTIGGQEIALHKDGEQYVAHDVALQAGDAVSAFTIEGEASEVTSKKVANNNLSAEKVVIADVDSADIYYNIADKNLWISGLPAAGQHLLKNGETAIEMIHTDPYEGYDQYASGMLEFKANDTIKVLNTGADDSYAVIWCPSIVATSEALAGKFVYDGEKGEMKCTADCSAAVYLKIKSGVDEVYFGDVPEYVEEAVDYVNGFKSAMATACSAEGKKAAVEAAWALQATAYKALSEQAQAEVKLGGYSLVEEIKEFGARYVYIYEHHAAEWELEDFLDWKLTPNTRYSADLVNEANDSTMIIVITIAATSALAFTTLLVLKKRKQK